MNVIYERLPGLFCPLGSLRCGFYAEQPCPSPLRPFGVLSRIDGKSLRELPLFEGARISFGSGDLVPLYCIKIAMGERSSATIYQLLLTTRLQSPRAGGEFACGNVRSVGNESGRSDDPAIPRSSDQRCSARDPRQIVGGQSVTCHTLKHGTEVL